MNKAICPEMENCPNNYTLTRKVIEGKERDFVPSPSPETLKYPFYIEESCDVEVRKRILTNVKFFAIVYISIKGMCEIETTNEYHRPI